MFAPRRPMFRHHFQHPMRIAQRKPHIVQRWPPRGQRNPNRGRIPVEWNHRRRELFDGVRESFAWGRAWSASGRELPDRGRKLSNAVRSSANGIIPFSKYRGAGAGTGARLSLAPPAFRASSPAAHRRTSMSNLGSIHTYRSEVGRIQRFSGSTRETTVRRAVFNLINAYARPRDLLLCEELDYFNPRRRKTVRPDGTLKNTLRLDYGFWEFLEENNIAISLCEKLHFAFAKLSLVA